jgi:uncharacterized membrane protein
LEKKSKKRKSGKKIRRKQTLRSMQLMAQHLALPPEIFHDRIGRTTFGQMIFVPNGQDGANDRAGVGTNLLKIPVVELTYLLHQVHVKVNRIITATAQFEISKRAALWQLEGDGGGYLHGK